MEKNIYTSLIASIAFLAANNIYAADTNILIINNSSYDYSCSTCSLFPSQGWNLTAPSIIKHGESGTATLTPPSDPTPFMGIGFTYEDPSHGDYTNLVSITLDFAFGQLSAPPSCAITGSFVSCKVEQGMGKYPYQVTIVNQK